MHNILTTVWSLFIALKEKTFDFFNFLPSNLVQYHEKVIRVEFGESTIYPLPVPLERYVKTPKMFFFYDFSWTTQTV